MGKIATAAVLCAISAVMWQPNYVWAQQAKNSALAAPVPPQILSAKRVFISNEGGDINTNLGDLGTYGATPADAYNQFYGAMKSWGRYELASTPEDADLIVAFRLTVPIGEPGTRGAWADPQLRVVILDPKTRVTLWGFTEHVDTALLQGNRNKNLKAAVDKIVGDVKLLAAAQH